MIRALIFDFNGVLLDDESLHFEMFREQLAGEGVTITIEDYHDRYLGLDDRACFETALTDAGQTATPHRLDDLIERKAVRYAEEAARGLTFFPGAADCLTTMASHYMLAINSGALRPEIVYGLDELGCRDLIAVIVSAEEVPHCKPHPQGYSLALSGLCRFEEALGVPCTLKPIHCLVIEDSLAGIESAKGAGMWAVGVPNTYTREQLLEAGADEVVDALPSLTPSWIEERFHARLTTL
jgi:beta-phosphoglucomutase